MAAGTIVHVNAVGMLASVEEGKDPSLRKRPFVVANPVAVRAVVVDVSSAAHREGVRRGMSLSSALYRVPGLEVRPPRYEFCKAVDAELMKQSLAFTPLVERAGVGHIFLDLAGTRRLWGAPEDAVQALRQAIAGCTGLWPALAIASNKTVCKVATRVFRPGGFVALSANEEGPLVRRQPVTLLPGVGPVLSARLALLGIGVIGELADLSGAEAQALGLRGRELVARARGLDESPVNPCAPERRAVRAEYLFEPDCAEPSLMRLRLRALSQELAFALRTQGMGARRAVVGITYTDGATSDGSMRAAGLPVRDDEVFALACAAFERARTRRVRVRTLRLALSEFVSAGAELDLFEPADMKKVRLQTALDRVRSRYGQEGVRPCAMLVCGVAR